MNGSCTRETAMPLPGTQEHENRRDTASLALSEAKNVPPIDDRRGFPTPSKFRFRAQTSWTSEGYSKTTIEGLDQMPPGAIEAILYPLTSYLAGGILFNARNRGIRIEALSFKLEGEMDCGRPDYQNIRLLYKVRSDASREEILALCKHVQKNSPHLDVILNPIRVALIDENPD